MHEPDVTLTDFALAIECLVFAMLLTTSGQWSLPFQLAFIFLFASNSIASLAGGLVHGFYPDHHFPMGRILWRVSLLAIGASTIAIWNISALLIFEETTSNIITLVAGVAFLIYSSLLFLRFPPFLWAVVFYLPAVIFMLVAFTVSYLSSERIEILYGLAGSLLTLVAAVIQRAKIFLHPRYFNHNALFHVVQAIALFMIFLAARGMIIF